MSYFTKYLCTYKLNENSILLLNTLTSAIDVVDNITFKKIKNMIGKNNINIKEDLDLYNVLKKRGYIYDSLEEEKKVLDNIYSINKYAMSNRLNTRFTICPTMGCNLRCTYCFENDDLHTDLNKMTDQQLKTIFNYIKETCQKLKQDINSKENNEDKLNFSTSICLFGGEPLLKTNYSIIKKIFEFADSIKVPIQIVTNGTTINYYLKLLEEYKDQVVMQITIDGDKSVHDKRRIKADNTGTFDDICNGIDLALKAGTRLHLRINIDRENIDKMEELKRIFDDRGWSKNPLFFPYASPVRCFSGKKDMPENILKDSDILNILMKNGWYGKQDSFIKSIVSPATGFVTRFFEKTDKMKEWKSTYCEGTMANNYCFAPNGTISTCLTCVGNNEYAIGKFDDSGINIDQNKLNLWTNRDPFKIKKCKDCKFILFCGGGCPVESLEAHGDINCAMCNDIENTLKTYVENTKENYLK